VHHKYFVHKLVRTSPDVIRICCSVNKANKNKLVECYTTPPTLATKWDGNSRRWSNAERVTYTTDTGRVYKSVNSCFAAAVEKFLWKGEVEEMSLRMEVLPCPVSVYFSGSGGRLNMTLWKRFVCKNTIRIYSGIQEGVRRSSFFVISDFDAVGDGF